MTKSCINVSRRFLSFSLLCGLTIGIWGAAPADSPPQDRKLLGSPEDALSALRKATEAKDRKALTELFGPGIRDLGSGDEVQDANDFANFARRLAKASKLVRQDDDTFVIQIGVEGYPFPVPIVKEGGGKWYFDTQAGLEEMINRRVGENELNVIRVCRGYVAAQFEYFSEDRDGDAVLEYAQRIPSSPGKHDGLYWQTRVDEPISPLGPLAAEAGKEGYLRKPGGASEAGPRPYHGYLYKILTRQGERAPGGKYDYIINGNMVAGFALVAWPVEWDSSGIMTFMVGANGKVYQKDLGEKTSEVAAALTEFAPDDSWKPAEN